MAVKIRLLRMGKIRNPQYRIVVADSRTKRDGKAIEFIGIYQPKHDPSVIEIDSERAQHWLRVGAQPSEPVLRLLEKTGDWQKFKGLPAPPPLLVASPRADRKALYEAEARTAAGLTPPPEPKPARKAAKAAAEKVDKPAAELAAQPVAELAAQPVAELAAQPVAEAAEPVETPAAASESEGGSGADAAAEA